MEVERSAGGEKSPEIRDQSGGAEAVAVTERTPQQPEQDVAVLVAQRRNAVEHAARPPQEMKSPMLRRIETVLSEGLAREYAALSENKREPFRNEGEQLAVWLEGALASGKVKPHEVLARMEHWLLILEGKDRYEHWLLQEAYNRTRRVMKEMMYSEIGH